MDKEHHVAWADRIGLNKQWAKDIQACSDMFGTDLYSTMVRRFKNNIPNIKNGVQLYTIIDEYENLDLANKKKQMMFEWKQRYPQEASNRDYVKQKDDELDCWFAEKLYHFILQTLEDYGFGFY